MRIVNSVWTSLAGILGNCLGAKHHVLANAPVCKNRVRFPQRLSQRLVWLLGVIATSHVHGQIFDLNQIQVSRSCRQTYTDGLSEDNKGNLLKAIKTYRNGLDRTNYDEAPKDWVVLMVRIAEMETLLGMYKPAGDDFRLLLPRALATFGEKSDVNAEANHFYALLLSRLVKMEEAERIMGSVVKVVEELHGKDSPEWVYSASHWGGELFDLGKMEEAEALSRLALEKGEALSVPGRGERHLLSALANLGNLMSSKFRYAEAVAFRKRVLDITTNAFGFQHPYSVNVLVQYARSLQENGEWKESETKLRYAMELMQRNGENQSKEDLAEVAHLLARNLEKFGASEEADHLHSQSLTLLEGIFDENHIRIGNATSAYASYLSEVRRFDEAEPLFRRALRIHTLSPSADKTNEAQTANNFAMMLQKMGRLREAEPLFKRALKLREPLNGQEGTDYAVALNNLVNLYIELQLPEEAEPMIRQAIKILETSKEAEQSLMASCLNQLAQILRMTNRREAGGEALKRALEIGEKDPINGKLALRLNNYGEFLLTEGKYEQALKLLKRAVALNEKALDYMDLVGSMNLLATAQEKLKLRDDAVQTMRKILAICESAQEKSSMSIATYYYNLAQLLARSGGEAKEIKMSFQRSSSLLQGFDPIPVEELVVVAVGFGEYLMHEEEFAEAKDTYEGALQTIIDASVTARKPHPQLQMLADRYAGALKKTDFSSEDIRAILSKKLRPLREAMRAEKAPSE